ncbi:MAG: response regulator transcription factor [Proteobacteria bacterium]|nr:response regulator transcription factor [Pseudomonadota bacterium]
MRTLLVEDQPISRDVLCSLLKARVGEIDSCIAEGVDEAVRCLGVHGSDLIFADFSTGDVCDAGRFEEIVSNAGAAPVIALDRRVVGAHLKRAMGAGAKAYITKTSTRELIDAAIGVVLAGGVYFPQTPSDEAVEDPIGWVQSLSRRQTQVLALMMRGRSNRDIATELGVSVATIKLHVHAILRAAEARNRTEAVLKAQAQAG